MLALRTDRFLILQHWSRKPEQTYGMDTFAMTSSTKTPSIDDDDMDLEELMCDFGGNCSLEMNLSLNYDTSGLPLPSSHHNETKVAQNHSLNDSVEKFSAGSPSFDLKTWPSLPLKLEDSISYGAGDSLSSQWASQPSCFDTASTLTNTAAESPTNRTAEDCIEKARPPRISPSFNALE